MDPVRIARGCPCGSHEMIIGQAANTAGRTIYPYVCTACGEVQTQYASRTLALQAGHLPIVKTRTQRKPAQFVRMAQAAEERRCEVCGAGRAQRHHWAPWYLFGEEADHWPTSLLCQSCHTRWHQVVTPKMGG